MEYSFWKGWGNARSKHLDAIKGEIKQGLGIASDVAFFNRRRGLVAPKESEIIFIESVFAKYGVDPQDVWGEEQQK